MSLDRGQLSVQFLISRVRASVKQAQLQLFPGDHPGPQKWLKLVLGVLDSAQLHLDASGNNSASGDLRRLELEYAARAVTEAYSLLREMDGADAAALPFPLIAPLQRWFDRLQLPNTTFFRALLDSNYELRTWQKTLFSRYRAPAPSLTTAISEIEWPILRVTVPAKAFTLIPHLAIVAHEIGHALVGKIVFANDPLLAEWPGFEARVRARLSGAALDAKAKEAWKRILSSWYQEFAADAFMQVLTGPAGFFALADLTQILDGGAGGYSHTHPASFQRRAILHQRLEIETGGISFRSVFLQRTGVDLVADINGPLISTPAGPDDIFLNAQRQGLPVEAAAVMAELYQLMPTLANAVHSSAHQVVTALSPDLVYTPEKLNRDLNAHLGPLLEAIPPIEEGDDLDAMQPMELATILNVGWALMLTKLDQLKVRADDQADRLEKLHGLLLKAIELSEARRAWMAA